MIYRIFISLNKHEKQTQVNVIKHYRKNLPYKKKYMALRYIIEVDH